MISTPKISLEEAQDVVAAKTAPKVTKESIEAKIAAVDYFNHETLTICIITMKSGFKQIGQTKPVDPANYDPAVGERYAYEDAFRGLWAFEGYFLCEKLMEDRQQEVLLNLARSY